LTAIVSLWAFEYSTKTKKAKFSKEFNIICDENPKPCQLVYFSPFAPPDSANTILEQSAPQKERKTEKVAINQFPSVNK